MKEKIYTIPVNEAYDVDCECPLCLLQNKLERDAVSFALGDAMMQPDHREASNKIGYCREHFSLMMKRPNKLSLALILDTHLENIRAELDKCAKSASPSGKGLFGRDKSQDLSTKVCGMLDELESSCMICKKIDGTMEHYIDVLFYMWDKDDEFRAKFERSKGVCLPHLKLLAKSAPKYLSKGRAGDFLAALLQKETAELSRIQEDIHKFTLKFDYRNADMPWGTAQDAPIRTVEKITGSITPLETEE